MESRNVTVINSLTQSRVVLPSSTATTLGELKAELEAAGMSVGDMLFVEGVSHTTMVDNNSILPSNIPYTNPQTGEQITTNDLVFMVTEQYKKTKSGAPRATIYAIIKDNDALKKFIKDTFSTDYTHISTEDLESLIEQFSDIVEEDDEEDVVVDTEEVALEEKIKDLTEAFVNELVGLLTEKASCDKLKNEPKSAYSDEEINNLFQNMQ